MELKAYSIYDSKAEVYNTPFFQKTAGEAIRNFSGAANDPQTMICKHPEDFDLFEIGTYNDNSGALTSHKAPIHIGKALEYSNSTEV